MSSIKMPSLAKMEFEGESYDSSKLGRMNVMLCNSINFKLSFEHDWDYTGKNFCG